MTAEGKKDAALCTPPDLLTVLGKPPAQVPRNIHSLRWSSSSCLVVTGSPQARCLQSTGRRQLKTLTHHIDGALLPDAFV